MEEVVSGFNYVYIPPEDKFRNPIEFITRTHLDQPSSQKRLFLMDRMLD